VADLTARLAERFRLLRGGRRAVERHQTLRATVAWSYELLNGRERALFNRLSVFAGGFDLAAAEAVCGDESLGNVDVDDLLGSLVDKSMVAAEAGGRYGLLETLRQFGEEQLAGSGHTERFRAAHLAHYEDLVLQVHEGLQGPHEAWWWRRLNSEVANVRAAFAWACDRGNVDAAVAIATHLVRPTFWHSGGEPFEWVQTAGALPGVADHPKWPTVLAGMARAVFEKGDLAAAAALADRAAAAQGADAGTSVDYLVEELVAFTWVWQGKLAEALPVCAQVIELARRDGNRVSEAWYESGVAMILTNMGRFDEAMAAAFRGERLADATGNPTTMAWARLYHGVALADTQPDEALRPLEEALEIAAAADSTWIMSYCLRNIASIRANLGDPLGALDLSLRAVQMSRRQGTWAHVWHALLGLADVLAHLDSAETAAQLLAGARRSSAASIPRLVRLADRLQARLTDDLGAARLAELSRAGEQLTAPQAAALAEAEAERLLQTTDSS
jgi:tetratricopeptide (TPR) repeat protein